MELDFEIDKITYQKTFGAVLISERRMAIFEESAKDLLDKYFPETEAKL